MCHSKSIPFDFILKESSCILILFPLPMPLIRELFLLALR
ncbi:hypothetical protein VCCP104821_1416 [Vibrio cholerae CP1048(21)]|nr:hypothetical protein VCCP104821_1416 [Vibrio cholerae CP1048(21)]